MKGISVLHFELDLDLVRTYLPNFKYPGKQYLTSFSYRLDESLIDFVTTNFSKFISLFRIRLYMQGSHNLNFDDFAQLYAKTPKFEQTENDPLVVAIDALKWTPEDVEKANMRDQQVAIKSKAETDQMEQRFIRERQVEQQKAREEGNPVPADYVPIVMTPEREETKRVEEMKERDEQKIRLDEYMKNRTELQKQEDDEAIELVNKEYKKSAQLFRDPAAADAEAKAADAMPYGYVIFGSDTYTLTAPFLKYFDLEYNSNTQITIPSSFVSLWLDIKKNRRFGFFTSLNPTNDVHLELIKIRDIVEPWELRWRKDKRMNLTTRTDRKDATTNVEIKRLKNNSLCLSVTSPVHTVSGIENVEFLCKDNTTYPMLKLANGLEISTENMSQLINWGSNSDNQCFRSLSMFGMFILLCTIVNAKTDDKRWKKIFKNGSNGEIRYGFRNLKDEFPIHLLRNYDKNTEQEELPPNPNQAAIDLKNQDMENAQARVWLERTARGYQAGPPPRALRNGVNLQDGRSMGFDRRLWGQ